MGALSGLMAEIEGVEELSAQFDRLSSRIQNKLAKEALDEAAEIVAGSARSKVSVRSGLLASAIGRKDAKRSRKGKSIFAIVGPRRGHATTIVGPGGEPIAADPVKYAHLVEKGRKSVSAGGLASRLIGKLSKRAGNALGGSKQLFDAWSGRGLGRSVQAARAKPFLAPALAETSRSALAAIRQTMEAGLASRS